jgi:tryptophan-rich sensory protein
MTHIKILSIAATVFMSAGGVASFSATSSPRARGAIVKNYEFSSSKWANVGNPPSVKVKQTALEAVPSWTYYSIGHILGGCTGTPLVLRATKSWYRRISLPAWTPPDFVFGPTWTTLYGLMGFSLSRIAKSSGPTTNTATKLWAIHYALNLVWAPVFFGMKRLRLGFIINLILIVTLGLTLPLFYRIDPLSAYLQVPYFFWLIFATKLNQTICQLNPTVAGINEAMVQADLFRSGPGYNDAMLQSDIEKLQSAAAKYAGL